MQTNVAEPKYETKNADKKPIIVSIEGNIGSGKTTIIDNLEKYYNLQLENDDKESIIFLREPVDIWKTISDKNGETILEKFYNNTQKFSFAFQVMAYSTRTAKLADTIKNNPNCKIIICERSLEADNNVFAKMLKDSNNMEEVEYQIYEHFYNTRKQDMNLDAVIYIDASPNVCLQRVKKRNRDGEDGISYEYLKTCKDYHDNWLLNNKTNVEVFRIDTDKDAVYDLKNEDEIGYKWMKSIQSFINKI
jgi:deoxyadenosine/deoxycytidine kinase|tara:strand:- start:770 stop:1513 length:744 start_codon:yes stop_codon:yes gene_type:complete